MKMQFLPVSVSNYEQAVNTGYKPNFRQGLLMKHIRELAKTSLEMAVGGGWQ